MWIIEIAALENGAHRNQSGVVGDVPAGWAAIPDGMEVPDTFPFVHITVDGGIVTGMTAGVVPDVPDLGSKKPSVEARLTALEAEAEQAKADREALNILLGGAE